MSPADSRRAGKNRYHLIVDPETSVRLGRIRQTDTSPELLVRKIVHALGHRFRVRNRDLPGSPDLANRSRRWAIFVHGCYWHAHSACSRATIPKRNRAFWKAKFRANRKRDERALRNLRRMGWVATVVWECELERPGRVANKLGRRLNHVS